MLAHDLQILHSSSESGWMTPDDCFDLLNNEFHFCLDAAADAASTKCDRYIGPDQNEDGLEVDWAARIGVGTGLSRPIWINPPYSKKAWRKSQAAGAPNQAMRIEKWAEKCWRESQKGCTIVGLFPFSPQTSWYVRYVMGIGKRGEWLGHAAMQERRIPHRVSFVRPDGQPAGSAGVNSVILVWTPARGIVGPWSPHSTYWSFRASCNTQKDSV